MNEREQLVEKMQRAYTQGVKDSPHTACKQQRHDENCCSHGMAAALDVAIEATLKKPIYKEIIAVSVPCGPSSWSAETCDYLARFIEDRHRCYIRRRQLADRVTFEPYGKDRWVVLLDGANPASSFFESKKDAEIYRLGLIAKLEAEK